MNACFAGYVVQAVVNNFAPLLFLTFSRAYGISLSNISILISLNFALQLATDALSAAVVDRLGYRVCIVAANVMSAAGLVMLAVLPNVLPVPFAGILIAVVVYAVGGGLLEVLVSPIMEACPTPNKEKAMSLLHSFYCWGHLAVVFLSTAFFRVAGIDRWPVMACVWAVLPLAVGAVFLRAPLAPVVAEGEAGLSVRDLFGNGVFWFLMLMMMCAGASEQAVSQWASAFAERALGVPKTVGDLAGPAAFALFMGTSRAIFGARGERMNLSSFMTGSAVLCVCSYLLISLSPLPVLSLAGCALAGFSVGIFWPGTFSVGTATIKNGGTAMFALFALAGDLGCASGPAAAGFFAEVFGGSLKAGILSAIGFPAAMLLCLVVLRIARAKK